MAKLSYFLLVLVLPVCATARQICCVKLPEPAEGPTSTACKFPESCRPPYARPATFDEAMRDTEGNTCYDPLTNTQACLPPKCIPQKTNGRRGYVATAVTHLFEKHLGGIGVSFDQGEGLPDYSAKKRHLHPLACKLHDGPMGWREVPIRGHVCCPGLVCKRVGMVEHLIHGGPHQGSLVSQQLAMILRKDPNTKYGFCKPE